MTPNDTRGSELAQSESCPCVRCGSLSAVPELDLCTGCYLGVRDEVAAGVARLEAYLWRWAAFDAWLHEHGLGTAVA